MVVNICSPDNLDPDDYGRPIIMEDQCDKVGVGFEDCVFSILDTAETACFKVLRKWKVTDWCQFEGGQYKTWVYDQVIKFQNTNAPSFTNGTCNDQEICSYDGECGPVQVQLVANAEDDCTPDDELVYRYFIDVDSDGTYELNQDNNPFADFPGVGNNATGSYPVGTHRILWEVEDKCGNKTTCVAEFALLNCKQPNAICREISVNLTLMDMDGDNDPETPLVMVEADDIGFNSFHPCYDDVTISFSTDPTDTMRSYGCEFADSTVIVEIWVTDPNGNQDFCSIPLNIQDNNDLCPDIISPVTGAISGFVYTEEDDMVEAAIIHLTGSGVSPDETDDLGSYGFDDMPFGGSYTVDPSKNDDLLNGVTTYDLALIQRHILGLQPLTSPYKQIAADVDNSERVDILDIIALRRVILGISDEFPNNESWRFVDAEFVFQTDQPLLEPFNEEYRILQFTDDMTDINFIGVKIGDVNASASTGNASGGDSRGLDYRFDFSVENIVMRAGETYTVPVYASREIELIGFQGTFEFNPGWLNVNAINGGAIEWSEGNMNLTMTDRGVVPFSWNTGDYIELRTDAPLFEIVITPNVDIPLGTALSIGSALTNNESYTDLGLMGLGLQFETRKAGEETPFELYQNVPNPFAEATTIGFRLPKDMSVDLTIYDNSGRVVAQFQMDAKAGYNRFDITKEQLNGQAGLMYYRLETEGFTAMKRMVGL
jgi:hypothetical protein